MAVTPLFKHPSPGPHLSARQAQLWRDIVKSLPPQDWRPADLPLLTEYILAVTMAEDLGNMIVPKLPLSELQVILGLRDREARRAAALARTLRLAPQSRYDRQRAATVGKLAGPDRPWETH